MENSSFGAILSDLKNPYFGQIEKRDLKQGELLVKIIAAPINPVDRLIAMGLFPIPDIESNLPLGIGFDGAGIVVDAHDESNKTLIGSTVSVIQDPMETGYQGAFRQYLYVKAEEAIPFPGGTDPETVFSISNPITAKNIIDFAQRDKHKALVYSAASSSIGKMMIKICKNLSIPLICLVRKEEQVSSLLEIGAEHVLNTESESFSLDLKELSAKLGATGFFDSVGGSLTMKVLKEMPPQSTAYLFDNMSGKK